MRHPRRNPHFGVESLEPRSCPGSALADLPAVADSRLARARDRARRVAWVEDWGPSATAISLAPAELASGPLTGFAAGPGAAATTVTPMAQVAFAGSVDQDADGLPARFVGHVTAMIGYSPGIWGRVTGSFTHVTDQGDVFDGIVQSLSLNSEGFEAGQGSPFDLAITEGTGRWNGRPGYIFRLDLRDHGEPGAGVDNYHLIVIDPSGTDLVYEADATLVSGNIQIRWLG
jgi:hypothetical protein